MTVEVRSGQAMPALGLGTWQLNDDTAGTVEEALRLGFGDLDGRNERSSSLGKLPYR